MYWRILGLLVAIEFGALLWWYPPQWQAPWQGRMKQPDHAPFVLTPIPAPMIPPPPAPVIHETHCTHRVIPGDASDVWLSLDRCWTEDAHP